jgi:hypothetical protein
MTVHGIQLKVGNSSLLGNADYETICSWAYELSTSVLNGTVPLSRLNDMATRIVATVCAFPRSFSLF